MTRCRHHDTSADQEYALGVLTFGGRYPGKPSGQGIADAIALAISAERHGWQEIWVAEHHFNPNVDASSALALAAYLLGASKTMSVGTAASVLSVHHPLAVAEQANLLAHSSGGRFRLGVARGMPTVDWNIFGGGQRRADHAIFAQALDILQTALTGRTVESVDGEFRFPPVAVTPGPRNEDPVPVFVAANSTATVHAAASRRLPLLLPPFAPTTVKQDLLETYRTETIKHGHNPQGVSHYNGAIAHIADNREQAEQELIQTWVQWFTLVTRDTPALVPIPNPTPADLAALLAHQPLGTPAQVADHLRTEMTRLKVKRTLLIIDGTGDPAHADHNAAAIAHAMHTDHA